MSGIFDSAKERELESTGNYVFCHTHLGVVPKSEMYNDRQCKNCHEFLKMEREFRTLPVILPDALQSKISLSNGKSAISLPPQNKNVKTLRTKHARKKVAKLGRPKNIATDLMAHRLAARGKTVTEIANEIGINKGSVSRILKQRQLVLIER